MKFHQGDYSSTRSPSFFPKLPGGNCSYPFSAPELPSGIVTWVQLHVLQINLEHRECASPQYCATKVTHFMIIGMNLCILLKTVVELSAYLSGCFDSRQFGSLEATPNRWEAKTVRKLNSNSLTFHASSQSGRCCSHLAATNIPQANQGENWRERRLDR